MQTKYLFLYFLRARKLSVIFAFLCVCIGTASFYSINGFTTSLRSNIANTVQAKKAGDASAAVAQNWSVTLLSIFFKLLGKGFATSHLTQFSTQLELNHQTVLASIKIIDASYPLYGTVTLSDKPFSPLLDGDVYITQETAVRFQIKEGELLNFGATQVRVAGVIPLLPDESFSGASLLSPTFFVTAKTYMASRLPAFEGRVADVMYHQLKDISVTQESFEKHTLVLEKEILSEFLHTPNDHQIFGKDLLESLQYLLIGIAYIAIILSSVGLFLSFVSLLWGVQKDIILLHMIGVSQRKIKFVLILMIVSLALLGAVLGVWMGWLVERSLVQSIGHDIIVQQASLHYRWAFLIVLFEVIPFVFFAYFFIQAYLNKSLKRGFSTQIRMLLFPFFAFLSYLSLTFVFLTIFSWLQLQSWNSALMLNGWVLGLLVVLVLFLSLVLFLFKSVTKLLEMNPVFFIASLHFFRKKQKYFPSLVALVLSGVLVLSLLIVRDTLLEKFSIRGVKHSSDLFLANTENALLGTVRKIVGKKNARVYFGNAPLLCASLTHVNGVVIDEVKVSRESDQGDRNKFLEHSYRIVFRDVLTQNEKIVKGEFWKKGQVDTEISLEMTFAQKLGLTIGDCLNLNVSGILIEGTVTSLREVDWAYLQPNSFIVCPAGKQKKIPQYVIASAFINTQQLDGDEYYYDAYLNIPLVDLEGVLQKIQTWIVKISHVIFVLLMLCLAASTVVLLLAFFDHDEEREQEAYVLKSAMLSKVMIWRVWLYEKLLFYLTMMISVLILLAGVMMSYKDFFQGDGMVYACIYFGIYALFLLFLTLSSLLLYRFK